MATKQTEYIKTWVKTCKSKIIEGFGGKCAICGYNKCQTAFDLHHINPLEKDFTISGFKIKNWSKIVNEVKKCVLLCSNCHRELHAGTTKLPLVVPQFDESLITKKEVSKDKTCQTCGKIIFHNKNRCRECYKKQTQKVYIERELLESLVKTHNMVQIGKMFGLSDNAIRKKCKKYNIDWKNLI